MTSPDLVVARGRTQQECMEEAALPQLIQELQDQLDEQRTSLQTIQAALVLEPGDSQLQSLQQELVQAIHSLQDTLEGLGHTQPQPAVEQHGPPEPGTPCRQVPCTCCPSPLVRRHPLSSCCSCHQVSVYRRALVLWSGVWPAPLWCTGGLGAPHQVSPPSRPLLMCCTALCVMPASGKCDHSLSTGCCRCCHCWVPRSRCRCCCCC